jgi:hypothetical protein
MHTRANLANGCPTEIAQACRRNPWRLRTSSQFGAKPFNVTLHADWVMSILGRTDDEHNLRITDTLSHLDERTVACANRDPTISKILCGKRVDSVSVFSARLEPHCEVRNRTVHKIATRCEHMRTSRTREKESPRLILGVLVWLADKGRSTYSLPNRHTFSVRSCATRKLPECSTKENGPEPKTFAFSTRAVKKLQRGTPSSTKTWLSWRSKQSMYKKKSRPALTIGRTAGVITSPRKVERI